MVNPRIGSILRILFQLPPSWKNAPLVTPALARPILFCFIVGNYLFFNLVVPMLSSGGKKKNYVKPAPPPTPKMERVERGNTATPAKKR